MRRSSALSDSDREGICADEVDQGHGMSKLISRVDSVQGIDDQVPSGTTTNHVMRLSCA